MAKHKSSSKAGEHGASESAPATRVPAEALDEAQSEFVSAESLPGPSLSERMADMLLDGAPMGEAVKAGHAAAVAGGDREAVAQAIGDTLTPAVVARPTLEELKAGLAAGKSVQVRLLPQYASPQVIAGVVATHSPSVVSLKYVADCGPSYLPALSYDERVEVFIVEANAP